jgi:hypothetical protein
MIEKAIFNRLTTFAEVSNLVGTRVYPVFLPEKTTMPAIVFRRVSTNGAFVSHSGTSGTLTSEFEVESYAKEVSVAKSLATAVRKAFSGFSGTVAGVTIYRASVDNEYDDYDFESGLYTIPIEVYLMHDEG